MKSCQCSRARLTIREGRAFCLNCERPNTKKAATFGAPALGISRIQANQVYEQGSVGGAVRAVEDCVAAGGDQQAAERVLRQGLCGAATPKRVFAEGMQAGTIAMHKALSARDLPVGVDVKVRKKGKA